MIEFIILLLSVLVSALASIINDRRHFQRLIQAERQLQDVLLFNERTPAPDMVLSQQSLVSGSVVIAVSYFKTFIAALQGLFGGPLNQYETSLEVARREALLRLRRAAKAQGATMVINVRLETSSLSKQGNSQSVGAVEVLAYGTALEVNTSATA